MKRSSHGFTLIELIVTIAILGVIATVLIVALKPLTQIKKARDAGRKQSLKQVQNILEQYYNDKGVYPPTSCWSGSACWSTGSSSFLATGGGTAANYASSLPTDPSQSGAGCNVANSHGYYYYTSNGGSTYSLIGALEITTDSGINFTPGGDGCTSSYNYALKSQQQ